MNGRSCDRLQGHPNRPDDPTLRCDHSTIRVLHNMAWGPATGDHYDGLMGFYRCPNRVSIVLPARYYMAILASLAGLTVKVGKQLFSCYKTIAIAISERGNAYATF